MLPLTDPQTAHDDFVKARMDGVDQTGDAKYALLPASQGQSSPESSAEKKAHLAEKVLSRWPYIFVGSFIFFLLIVGYIVWRCCLRKRCAERKKAKVAAAAGNVGGSPVGMRGAGSKPLQLNPLNVQSSYYPIHDSASSSTLHMPHSPSSPSYQKQYNPPSYYSNHSGQNGHYGA
jgi:hypothetical protein